MREFASLVSLATNAALHASRVILDIYLHSELQITEKQDKSPITQADLLSDEVIQSVLADSGITVVSEESEKKTDKTKLSEAYWLVDPLDGTKEFIKRNGEFCINIALVIRGLPMIGVIAIPVRNAIYWAVAGAGVNKTSVQDWKSSELNTTLPLSKPTLPSYGEKIVFLRSKSHDSEKSLKLQDQLKARFDVESLSVGSAIKFCYLAEGKGHIYHRPGPTMEWDTAAGHALLREIGGNLIDLSTGGELTYGKKDARNPEFLATVLPLSLVI